LTLLRLFLGLGLQDSSQDLATDALGNLVYKFDTTSQLLVICNLRANPVDNVVLKGFACLDTFAWYNICSGNFCCKIFSIDANDCDIVDFFVCDQVAF